MSDGRGDWRSDWQGDEPGDGPAADPPRRRADRTPRQRLDARTRRAAILEAATEAFSRAPYPEVRMTDVAARVGGSPALLFRYYGSKAELYAAVLDVLLREVAAGREAAVAALPPGTPRRERLRVGLDVYLDHVAANPRAATGQLLGGEEPPEALAVRAEARAAELTQLRALLAANDWPRHDFALHGYLGFVDYTALAWVQAGCPDDRRSPLVDAALGALEGALGDWGG